MEHSFLQKKSHAAWLAPSDSSNSFSFSTSRVAPSTRRNADINIDPDFVFFMLISFQFIRLTPITWPKKPEKEYRYSGGNL